MKSLCPKDDNVVQQDLALISTPTSSEGRIFQLYCCKPFSLEYSGYKKNIPTQYSNYKEKTYQHYCFCIEERKRKGKENIIFIFIFILSLFLSFSSSSSSFLSTNLAQVEIMNGRFYHHYDLIMDPTLLFENIAKRKFSRWNEKDKYGKKIKENQTF